MSRGRIGSLLATILLAGLAVLALSNLQYIQDAASYHQYQPSSEITALADDAGMNERGRFLFYASQPSLEGAKSFDTYCGKTEKSTAILGCYNGRKIYIYDIKDPRLAGIRPTTAAHEMLHAAYARLSSSDREMVDRLLDREYETIKNDSQLADRMAFYDRTQPGEHMNELHSIIGTEKKEVSPELEEYYRRYFSDRSKVIAQHEQYYSLFAELRERADTLTGQIDTLRGTLERDRAAYDAQVAALQSSIAEFNSRAENGQFESQAAFARERQALFARSASLEDLRARINGVITEYNRLIEELNAIAIETEELNRSIDSNLAPAPSI